MPSSVSRSRCRTIACAGWSSTLRTRSRSRPGGQRYAATVCHDQDRAFSWIDQASGMPWAMVFQWVPEPKTVKNRMHWDVWGETEDLLAAGAG